MAVTLSDISDNHGYTMLSLFDVSTTMVQAAKKAKVYLKPVSTGLYVFVSEGGDPLSTSVSVKGSAISLAKQGNLGPASKQAIKYAFEDALKKALAKAGAPLMVDLAGKAGSVAPGKTPHLGDEAFTLEWNVPPTKEDIESITPVVPDAVLPGGGQVGTLEADPSNEDADGFTIGSGGLDKGKAMSMDPVKLYQATECHQPVFGASPGSTYWVAALFLGLNLATRRKGGQVSFRVEGPALQTYKEELEDLGFTVNSDYASTHLGVVTQALYQKTVGAMVGRIGFHRVVKVGNLKWLYGVSK